MDTQIKTEVYWGEFFALLSMDVCSEYFTALGYADAPDMATVRTDIRSAILKNREHYLSNPEVIPDIANEVFNNNLIKWTQKKRHGLYQFALDKFATAHSDLPNQSAWHMALYFFPNQFERTVEELQKEPGLIDQVQHTLNRYLRDFPQKLEAQSKNAPLSSWDAQMCAIHNWNILDEDTTPILSLDFSLGLDGAVKSIDWLNFHLTQKAKKILFEEVKLLVENQEIWMPEPISPLGLEV